MKLILVRGAEPENEFRLHDGINTIGRGASNRIRLLDPRVSRSHCRIRKVGESLFLIDLGTKNGTRVNDKLMSERELEMFDEIKVGNTILRVVQDDYVVEKPIPPVNPKSFFRRIALGILGNGEKQKVGTIENEFPKFSRRGRKLFWRPSVDTDPPEGSHDTVGSRTDPD